MEKYGNQGPSMLFFSLNSGGYMSSNIETITQALDGIRHIAQGGAEYWLARELQSVLAYAKWENFESVIQKARMAAEASGVDPNDHLLETGKVMTAGKGAQLERKDYFLSRYGCYLIAMNGDPAKTEIATAQTYFAVQTRRQEISDEQALLEKRVEVRNRVTEAVKKVNSAAKNCRRAELWAFPRCRLSWSVYDGPRAHQETKRAKAQRRLV